MTTHTTVTQDAPMNTKSQSTHQPPAEPIGALVDAMLDRYVDWREDAANVAEAHCRWREAPRADEAELYSAYLAALDQEHSAAIAYELAVHVVERWFARADRHPHLTFTAPALLASRVRIEVDRRSRAGGWLDANRD
jgi:hypothetical protein